MADRRFPTPPLPPEPTRFLPGSAGKVDVMEDRVAAGWQPFHPLDYRGDDDEEPGYVVERFAASQQDN